MSTLGKLDANQVIRKAFADVGDPTNPLPTGGMAVVSIGGTLVPEKYDQLSITIVASGNGAGEIETIQYKMTGTLVATITLSYDASNRLIDVIRS